MKKSIRIVILLALFVSMGCKDHRSTSKATAKEDSTAVTEKHAKDDFAELTFEDENAFHDFGTIKEGAVVTHEFLFINTGTQPLKIVQAKPSCGCTVSDWTKEEIAPGEIGSVTVRFDSKGRHDQQNKSVRLITNTKNGNESVRFTAFVK